MLYKIIAVCVAITLVATTDVGSAQLKKLRFGTTIGELKSVEPAKNKRDTEVAVLASGEEKPRRYTVNPQQKDLLAVLKDAKVGDRVEIEWYDTVEGLCVDKFKLLKKQKRSTEK